MGCVRLAKAIHDLPCAQQAEVDFLLREPLLGALEIVVQRLSPLAEFGAAFPKTKPIVGA